MNPYSRLSAAVLKQQPATAARVLENFSTETVVRFLSTTSEDTSAQIIALFTPGFAAGCLTLLEPSTAGRILDLLLPDYQIMLLRQLDHDDCAALLQQMQPDHADALRRLLPYPEGTAGAFMEAPLASVPEDLPVRHALRRIRRVRRGMKFYLYAIDARGRLTGVTSLHELLNAPPASTISDVMERRVARLAPDISMAAVLGSPYWKEYHALPVTDSNNILLGIIRQKSLYRLQEQAVHNGTISGGLETIITAGELFSVTAVQLLSALIDAGTTTAQRKSP
jgi:magnesium transporter